MMTPEERKERRRQQARAYYYKDRESRLARMSKWARDNREYNTARARAYYATDTGKAAVKKAIKKYNATHPERHKSWIVAQRFYPEAKPCEVCGKLPTHRHHPDPLKQIEIIFLCPLHHNAAHAV